MAAPYEKIQELIQAGKTYSEACQILQQRATAVRMAKKMKTVRYRKAIAWRSALDDAIAP